MVINMQVEEYESVLLEHPQKHFWLVTLEQGNARARQIIPCVCGHVEVAYVLVSQPAPGGLLSCIIGHAKALPIDFMK